MADKLRYNGIDITDKVKYNGVEYKQLKFNGMLYVLSKIVEYIFVELGEITFPKYNFTYYQLVNKNNHIMYGNHGPREIRDIHGELIASINGVDNVNFYSNIILELSNGTYFYGGNGSTWILVDRDYSLITTGTSNDLATMENAIELSNGNVLAVGYATKWNLFEKDSMDIINHGQLDSSSTGSILAAIKLDNGNILTIGPYGYYWILDESINIVSQGQIVGAGDPSDMVIITSVKRLSNGNLFVFGSEVKGSAWIIDQNMNVLNTWTHGKADLSEGYRIDGDKILFRNTTDIIITDETFELTKIPLSDEAIKLDNPTGWLVLNDGNNWVCFESTTEPFKWEIFEI